MKKHILTIALTLLMLPVLALTSYAQSNDGPVKHVVVFKFKKDATAEQIQKITDEFRALTTKIEGITGFEYGKNTSPEGKDQGFTHVYLLTFKNAAARDAYLPHPDHKKFGGSLRMSGIYEGVLVFDYVPEK